MLQPPVEHDRLSATYIARNRQSSRNPRTFRDYEEDGYESRKLIVKHIALHSCCDLSAVS